VMGGWFALSQIKGDDIFLNVCDMCPSVSRFRSWFVVIVSLFMFCRWYYILVLYRTTLTVWGD